MERFNLYQQVRLAYERGRRLVAPLMGFPGIPLTRSTIKLAQQNYGEHYRVIAKIVETFGPDLVFPLMDLSVEANATGRYTIFPKDESATVPKESFSMEELERLQAVDIQKDTRLFGYVKTVRMMNERLPAHVVRGAYVTGPYTLAGLIMGSDDAALATLLNSDNLHRLVRFATDTIRQYAGYFMDVGAELICVLEPSAMMLGPKQFAEFSRDYVKEIAADCHSRGVSSVYHVCGNSMHVIDRMVESGVDGISIDSAESGVDIGKVIQSVPPDVVVVGNMNPVGTILNGFPSEVEQEAAELLRIMDAYPNYILSTGCDLPQNVPSENILALMQTGREHKIGSN